MGVLKRISLKRKKFAELVFCLGYVCVHGFLGKKTWEAKEILHEEKQKNEVRFPQF